MKLSKKSRYGLTALVDLAVNSHNGHVALNSIAERNDISLQYLEQVFASLRRAGIVKSVKGPQGGYLLSRDPDQITVSEILEATEGSYLLENEELSEKTVGQGISITIQKLVIDQVNQEMERLLNGLTLADLEKDYSAYAEYAQNMYYI